MVKRMNYSQKLLTELKTAHGLRSNYMAAKVLGLSESAIHNVDKKGRHFSDENTIKIAQLIDLDPSEATIRLHIDTATSEEMRIVWKQILDSHNIAAALTIAGARASKVA